MEIEKVNAAIRTIREICEKEDDCEGCPLYIFDKNEKYRNCAVEDIPAWWKEL